MVSPMHFPLLLNFLFLYYGKKCKCRQGSCVCNPCSSIKTQEGLAYTPSQMNELRKKGIPISNMMVSDNCFDDGDMSGDMCFDPVLARGVNEIEAWNMECEAKKRLMSAHVRDVESFGD